MDIVRIKLDEHEAIKTKNGFIVMRDGEPMEVESTTIESLIKSGHGSDIDDICETLLRFRRTKGISEVYVTYNKNE